ncbi:amidase signature domain-containing protein [Aspergillus germanicus]
MWDPSAARRMPVPRSLPPPDFRDLTTGQLSAVKPATGFCKRAATAQQLTCCLTEMFFDQALVRAEKLDRHLAETGKPVGPLHGIPVSVHTTLGYFSFLDRRSLSMNSPMVGLLLRAGGIIYVKPHLPQTMMTCDSNTNVFGRARNPYSRFLTAGGSCGGEGALIAMRGSILGVGTDTPLGRLGLAGGIAVALGPLCTSLRDADLFFRTIVSCRLVQRIWMITLWDPRTSNRRPKPQVTIGILPEDPDFPLQPPMYRTITTVTQKLAAAGHRVFDIPTGDPPSFASTCQLAFRFFKMDPHRTPLQNIKNGGAPYVPSLSVVYDLDNPGQEHTLHDLYDLNIAKAQVAAKMRQAWLKSGVDVIVAPIYQSCAPLHDTNGDHVYTVIWNVVDYPACVIPVGHADKTADAKYVRDVAYTPVYQPDKIEGAPCHMQIIGRRLKDEVLLQHAKAIEKILAGED